MYIYIYIWILRIPTRVLPGELLPYPGQAYPKKTHARTDAKHLRLSSYLRLSSLLPNLFLAVLRFLNCC